MTIVPSTRIGEILDASITNNVVECAFAACAIVAARLELDAPAQAATFSCSFTKIAATGGEFSFLRRDAAINDCGEVAFAAFLSAGGFSTSRGSSGALTTIANTSGEFSSLSLPSINNGGDVAQRN